MSLVSPTFNEDGTQATSVPNPVSVFLANYAYSVGSVVQHLGQTWELNNAAGAPTLAPSAPNWTLLNSATTAVKAGQSMFYQVNPLGTDSDIAVTRGDIALKTDYPDLVPLLETRPILAHPTEHWGYAVVSPVCMCEADAGKVVIGGISGSLAVKNGSVYTRTMGMGNVSAAAVNFTAGNIYPTPSNQYPMMAATNQGILRIGSNKAFDPLLVSYGLGDGSITTLSQFAVTNVYRWAVGLNAPNKYGTLRPAILRSSDGLYWENVNTLANDFVGSPIGTENASCVWGDPLSQTVLVGTTQSVSANPYGAYLQYTSDNGTTWARISPNSYAANTTITAIGKSGANYIIGYNSGTNVYYSPTLGSGWTAATHTLTSGQINGFVPISGVGVIAFGATGIALSVDDGVTWTQKSTSAAIAMKNHTATSKVVAINNTTSASNNIFISNDNGNTFTPISATALQITAQALNALEIWDDKCVIVGNNGMVAYALMSSDLTLAASWTVNYLGAVALRSCAGKDDPSKEVMIFGDGVVYSTTDFVTFYVRYRASNINAVDYNATNTTTLLGYSDGMVVRSNNLADFTFVGVLGSAINNILRYADKFVICGSGGAISIYDCTLNTVSAPVIGGTSFSATANTNNWISVAHDGGTNIVVGSSLGLIAYSTDSGATFTVRHTKQSLPLVAGGYHPTLNAFVFITTGTTKFVYAYTSDLNTWLEGANSSSFTAAATTLNAKLVYVSGQDKLMYVTNAGELIGLETIEGGFLTFDASKYTDLIVSTLITSDNKMNIAYTNGSIAVSDMFPDIDHMQMPIIIPTSTTFTGMKANND